MFIPWLPYIITVFVLLCQRKPAGALVVPVSVFVCGSVLLCTGGAERDGSEENGGRCGSYRYLRRRRGGIQPGIKSIFSTLLPVLLLLSIYGYSCVVVLIEEHRALMARRASLAHRPRFTMLQTCSHCRR